MSLNEFFINRFAATAEQSAIISSILAGDTRILVNAFAGTGKTSTLIGIAQALPVRMKILYVVFTTAMGAEAKSKFPKNVEVKTVNAFAKRFAMGDRTLRNNNYSATEIRKLYNLEYKDAVSAIKQFEQYCNSSIIEIPLHWHYAEYVLDMWESMESGAMDATHSWYLKNFHLMLSKDGKPHNMPDYELIMLDEYQDTNGVTKSIVELMSPKQLIKVGDYNQGIFGFRGAENTMKSDMRSGKDKIFYLTSSFRYNQDIADGASTILQRFLGEEKHIIGLGEKTTTHTACYISRTNSSLITGIDYYVSKGDKYRTLRDPSLIFGLPLAISALDAGKKDQLEHRFKYLLWEYGNCVGSFAEHCKTLGEINNDMELYSAAKIATEYNFERLQHLASVSQDFFRSGEQVHYFFGTAHSVKGLEFDFVRLVDDFKDYVSLIANSLYKNASDISNGYLYAFAEDVKNDDTSYVIVEEFNLLYVAYTRALVKTSLPDTLNYYISSPIKDIEESVRAKYSEIVRENR